MVVKGLLQGGPGCKGTHVTLAQEPFVPHNPLLLQLLASLVLFRPTLFFTLASVNWIRAKKDHLDQQSDVCRSWIARRNKLWWHFCCNLSTIHTANHRDKRRRSSEISARNLMLWVSARVRTMYSGQERNIVLELQADGSTPRKMKIVFESGRDNPANKHTPTIVLLDSRNRKRNKVKEETRRLLNLVYPSLQNRAEDRKHTMDIRPNYSFYSSKTCSWIQEYTVTISRAESCFSLSRSEEATY